MNDLIIGQMPSPAITMSTLLAKLADNLDITPTQHKRAESAYESITEVLAADPAHALQNSRLFPQGSFALGTVVKPLTDDKDGFDVDLICRLAATTTLLPAQAKELIRSCLAKDGRYADKLKEKARCWRITYAGEFHLDVAPVVPNTGGGDWIPDRELRRWLSTHPEAYAIWFNALADSAKTELLLEKRVVAKADVAPFPVDPYNRGWLRKLVQMLKRHRSVWKQSQLASLQEFAPISIIITTVTARAYERVRGRHFETPLDLLRAIIDDMPNHVRQVNQAGRLEWWVRSPVAPENLANRWNEDERWSRNFFTWHESVTKSFVRIGGAEGLDRQVAQLSEAFGESVAKGVAQQYGEYLKGARDRGQLRMASSSGLVTVGALGSTVKPHTFFGDE